MKVNQKDYRETLTDIGKTLYDFMQDYGLPHEHFSKIIGISHAAYLQKVGTKQRYVLSEKETAIALAEMEHLKACFRKNQDIINGVYSEKAKDNAYYYARRKYILPHFYEGAELDRHLDKKISDYRK